MQHHPIRILALDPGLRRIGYALLDNDELIDYGVRAIPHKRTLETTLAALEVAADRLISDRKPHVLALEQTVFSQVRNNVRPAIVNQLILRIAKNHRIRSFAYNPRTIRKTVCDDGNANRMELARTIISLYPETRVYLESNRRWRESHFQHIYDAIACAVTHRIKTRDDPDLQRSTNSYQKPA